MSRDPKTIEQLEREIAYFRWELERRRSGDRRVRAERAIALRERQLAAARRAAPPDRPHNALQRVVEGDRR